MKKNFKKRAVSMLLALLMVAVALPVFPSVTVEAAKKKAVRPTKVTGLKKSKTAEKSITVKYKKAKRATGYQVVLYNSKGKKLKTVTTKKTSATIKGLKASTTYKVRVRAYRKVKVKVRRKTKTKTYYGSYSKTLRIRTAKHKHSWKAHKKLVKKAYTKKIYQTVPEEKMGNLSRSGLNNVTDYEVYKEAGGTMTAGEWFHTDIPWVEYDVYKATRGATEYLIDSSAYNARVDSRKPLFYGNVYDGYEALTFPAPLKVTVQPSTIGLDKNGEPYSFYEWFRKRYNGLYHPQEKDELINELMATVSGVDWDYATGWFKENYGEWAIYENCPNVSTDVSDGGSIGLSIPTGRMVKKLVDTKRIPAQYKTDYHYCTKCKKRK